jgi:hypothetical protein
VPPRGSARRPEDLFAPLAPPPRASLCRPPPSCSYNFNFVKSGDYIFLAVADEAFGRQVPARGGGAWPS